MTEPGADEADDKRARLDLQLVSPTGVPEILRGMSRWAVERAGDPRNTFDDNPFVGREWLAIAEGLSLAAADIEKRWLAAFDPARRRLIDGCPGPERFAECSNHACRRSGCQGRSPMP